MEVNKKSSNESFIGVLMLETTFPRIRGDIGNSDTFDFPVRYRVVKGATPGRVVIHADRTLLRPFIEAGLALADEGACAISTSCGFLALYQQALADELPVPVFSSSLMQVNLVKNILKKGQKVGIITARKSSLTDDHLRAVGIENIPITMEGMENYPEFTSVFINGKTELDYSSCEKEMESAAINLIRKDPGVGPIILECTNMPPYADSVRRVTKRPVFDITTLLEMAWRSRVVQ